MTDTSLVQVLRPGVTVASLFPDENVLYWSFCATGQAFSPEPLPLPAAMHDLSLVEPLGGTILHLLVRPSLKLLGDERTEIPECGYQAGMLKKLLNQSRKSQSDWEKTLQARDIFGLRAVDYSPKLNVLRGRPLEQGVIAEKSFPKDYRGIILSLTKNAMLRSDLLHGLKKAKETSGIDIFPGIVSSDPKELRLVLLKYFDLLHHCLSNEALNYK